MTSRLETVDRQLAQTLAEGESTALRQTAEAVATYAVAQTGLSEPVVDAALRQLSGKSSNSDIQAQLEGLVERLDQLQWELQDRVVAGEAHPDAKFIAFSQARAAAALRAALDPDPVFAAQEAAYEALTAVDDPDAIRRIAWEQLAK